MSLSSGNSGARLIETITKFAPDAAFEGAFCQHLGKEVCPEVISVSPGQFTMERLESAPRHLSLLRDIESLLEKSVWSRPSQNYDVSGQMNFIEFQKSMGIETPEWAIPTEFCLIHGDPTVSNAMVREDGSLVLIDPRAPNGHIPSWKAVDMGKILQSFFGWEEVAYNEEPVRYLRPLFMLDHRLEKQARFWLGYHAARIQQLERSRNLNRPHILRWCAEIRGMCNV